jgi:hypothetical protein
MPRHITVLAILTLLSSGVAAQGYSGTYTTVNAAGRTVTLALRQDAQGAVAGTMVVDQIRAELKGSPQESAVVGIINGLGESMYFQAELDGDALTFVLVPADAQGNPNYDAAQQMAFRRGSATPTTDDVASDAAKPADPSAAMGASGGGAGAGGLGDGTPLANEWVAHLAGKKVTVMDRYSSGTAGGYTSRTDVFLCSNGEFLFRGQSDMSVDVGGASGYAGGNQANSGRWRIITQGQVAGIELRYGNGTVEQYRLTYQNGATYANDKRVYVTPAGICP